MKKRGLRVGDRVGYNHTFLGMIGKAADTLSDVRATVRRVIPGRSGGAAMVEWDDVPGEEHLTQAKYLTKK